MVKYFKRSSSIVKKAKIITIYKGNLFSDKMKEQLRKYLTNAMGFEANEEAIKEGIDIALEYFKKDYYIISFVQFISADEARVVYEDSATSSKDLMEIIDSRGSYKF